MQGLPSATDLSYFIEISECRSITKAAARLGISQPSLSAAVRRLEEALGASLLLRSHDGCSLTRAGVRLVTESRTVLDAWQQLTRGVASDESELRGRYRIGCHSSVGLYSLPHVLPKLVREHPELQFSVHNALSRTVLDDVLQSSVDLGIVVNPARHPDLVIRPLCRDEVRLWTLVEPTIQQKLRGNDPVIILDPSLFQTQKILQSLQKAGLAKYRSIDCSNLETIVELTAKGAGTGILPGRVVTGRPTAKLVPEVGFGDIKVTDSVCLVALAERHRSAAFKLLFRTFAHELSKTWATNQVDAPRPHKLRRET